MPHIDDGTLHALLDGALQAEAPDEAVASKAHLERCDDCRARLEEAARIRDAASGILSTAPEAADAPPDFDEVVARSRAAGSAPAAGARGAEPVGRRRRQLAWTRGAAWAATLVLALGTGYLIRDLAGPAAPPTGMADAERPAAGPSPAPTAASPRGPATPVAPGPASGRARGPVTQKAGEERQVVESEVAGSELAEAADRSEAAERGPEPARSRNAPRTEQPALTGAAGLEERAAAVGPVEGPGRWATATVEEVSTALGGPLYLLPRAELREVYLGDGPGGPAALSIQRLSSGVPVRVVQHRPPEVGLQAEVEPARAADAEEPAAPGERVLSLRAREELSGAPAPPAGGAGPTLPPPESARVTVDGFVLELTGSLPAELLAILGTAARPVPE